MPPCKVCNQYFRESQPTTQCRGLKGWGHFDTIRSHLVHQYCPKTGDHNRKNQLCVMCEEERQARMNDGVRNHRRPEREAGEEETVEGGKRQLP